MAKKKGTILAGISFAQILSIPEDILVQEVSGELVFLNLNSEIYFGLDRTGTRMWKLLTAGNTIQYAYERLLEHYDIPPDELRSELFQLIQDLVQHGLVEVHPA